MDLLEHLRRFEKAEKEVPRLRDVVSQLRTVLARLCMIQHAITEFQAGATDAIAFPYSELQVTVGLIDTLVTTAFDNLDVPFGFITDLRTVEIRLKSTRLLKDLFDSRLRRGDAVENIFDTSPRPKKTYQVAQGDTIRGIATRFLKDGSRWSEIVALNGLDYPYVVDTSAQVPAGKKVLIPGDVIVLPLDAQIAANQVAPRSPTDLASVLGTDIRVSVEGLIALDASGEIDSVSGGDNLSQALRIRLLTERGQLPLHPRYGSEIKAFIGEGGTPAAIAMAGLEIRRSVREDPRVTRLGDVTTSFDRTILDVKFDAFVIGQDAPVAQNLVFPL